MVGNSNASAQQDQQPKHFFTVGPLTSPGPVESSNFPSSHYFINYNAVFSYNIDTAVMYSNSRMYPIRIWCQLPFKGHMRSTSVNNSVRRFYAAFISCHNLYLIGPTSVGFLYDFSTMIN